jgi:hypothetical protein
VESVYYLHSLDLCLLATRWFLNLLNVSVLCSHGLLNVSVLVHMDY